MGVMVVCGCGAEINSSPSGLFCRRNGRFRFGRGQCEG